MQSQPLVSVIIPVYNSVDYFEACIKSVVNQSYRNLEIILVNDGCTDDTPQIVDRYAALDSRIIVINKQNEGTQYARRDGLRVATGEFVQSLDCDDELFVDSIEKRLKVSLEYDADLVVSPFQFNPVCGEPTLSLMPDYHEISGEWYLKKVLVNQAYWASWTLFQRRRLYIDNEIVFDPEILMTEDTIMTTQLAFYANKVVVSRDPVVKFTVRDDSLSNNLVMNDKQLHDQRKFVDWIENFLRDKGVLESYEMHLAAHRIHNYFRCLARGRRDYYMQDMRESYRLLQRYPDIAKYLPSDFVDEVLGRLKPETNAALSNKSFLSRYWRRVKAKRKLRKYRRQLLE